MAYKSRYKGSQVDNILDSVANKQDKLTAGTGISIDGNVISVTYSYNLFEVVSVLPSSNIDANKIYLVASSTTGTQNAFTEYVYVNNKWEKLGEFTTAVSLEGYATEEFVTQAISSFNTSTVTPLATRVTTLESTVSSNGEVLVDLNDRLETAESNITSLTGKVTTAESNISTLQDDLYTAQQDITGLETDVQDLQTNYTDKVSPIVDDPDYEVVLFLKE